MVEGINVPSDTDNRYSLGIGFDEDVWLQLYDQGEGDYFKPIRFRSPLQGAEIPTIAVEFYNIQRSFSEFGGRIPADLVDYSGLLDSVTLSSTIQVIRSEKQNEPRIKVTGLTDDEQGGDEDYSRWMDIAIGRNGDATVTFRQKSYDFVKQIEPEEVELIGSITFKTEENGGQFPIMAHVFTRIAEGIAKKGA